MAARLKRLEGMVREMLDEDGNLREPSSEHTAVGEEEDDSGGGDSDAGKLAPSASGAQVVRGPGARGGNTTYVGATHFMAMLGDVCVIVLLDIPVHHGPRDASSTPRLYGEKYCIGIMVTARELTSVCFTDRGPQELL